MCVSTGNRALDIGLGVAVGAATGGLTAPATFAGSTTALSAGTALTSFGTQAALGTVGTAALGGAVLGGVSSAVTSSLFAPPEIPDFPQQATPVAFQSTDPIKTTGSGGKQAAASLAEAVRRSKKRKLTQDDVADLSIDTSSFSAVGLQLA